MFVLLPSCGCSWLLSLEAGLTLLAPSFTGIKRTRFHRYLCVLLTRAGAWQAERFMDIVDNPLVFDKRFMVLSVLDKLALLSLIWDQSTSALYVETASLRKWIITLWFIIITVIFSLTNHLGQNLCCSGISTESTDNREMLALTMCSFNLKKNPDKFNWCRCHQHF